MIAASPEISRSGIVFAAAHVFPSFDDHHETEPSRLFLPTENPEAPFVRGYLYLGYGFSKPGEICESANGEKKDFYRRWSWN